MSSRRSWSTPRRGRTADSERARWGRARNGRGPRPGALEMFVTRKRGVCRGGTAGICDSGGFDVSGPVFSFRFGFGASFQGPARSGCFAAFSSCRCVMSTQNRDRIIRGMHSAAMFAACGCTRIQKLIKTNKNEYDRRRKKQTIDVGRRQMPHAAVLCVESSAGWIQTACPYQSGPYNAASSQANCASQAGAACACDDF